MRWSIPAISVQQVESTKTLIFEELIPEYGVREENFSFRALPTLKTDGTPVIAVSWVES